MALACIIIVSVGAVTAVVTREGCTLVHIYSTVLPLETRNTRADVAENTVLALSPTSDVSKRLTWI